MRSTRPLVVLLALLPLAACVRTARDPVTGKIDVDVESPLKKGEDWTGSFAATDGLAAVGGKATVRVLEGKANASVTIENGPSGATLPWFVHEGKCGEPGAIVGDRYAYRPLQVGSNGQAESSAQLGVGLNEAKNYHVAVHAAPGDAKIIACAGLTP